MLNANLFFLQLIYLFSVKDNHRGWKLKIRPLSETQFLSEFK